MKTHDTECSSTVRHITLALSLLTSLSSTVLAQHDVVPGGKHATAKEIQNEYSQMVLRGVQIFQHDWEKACNSGNVRDIADLYLKNAEILTTMGPTVKGRDSINAWYKAGLSRMRGCRLTYGPIIASGELASINGHMRYDIQLPTGGSVGQTVLFQMTLRQQYIDEWRIASQTGGDLPPIVSALAFADSANPTAPDSVGVRITDGLGHPLSNVSVVLSVEQRGGGTQTLSCVTDAKGRAVADMPKSANEITSVRVSTSLNREVTFLPVKTHVSTIGLPRNEGTK